MQSTNEMPLLTGQRDPREKRWFVYLAFLFPACAGFMFGYDIGACSGAKSSLKSFMDVSDLLDATITAASLIGATLGSVLVFYVVSCPALTQRRTQCCCRAAPRGGGRRD